MPLTSVFLLSASLITRSLSAFADPTPAQSAEIQKAFPEAIALADQGKWAEALEKFKQVGAIKMTRSVRYNIARCEEKLGQLSKALADYTASVQEPQTSTDEIPLIQAGRTAMEALAARIPRLRVRAAGRPTLTLDGNVISQAALDAPIPIDPGDHILVVDFGDKKVERPFSAALSTPPIEINADFEEAPGKTASGPLIPAPAWITGGVAIAGLVAGPYLYATASSDEKDLATQCSPSPQGGDPICPKALESDFDAIKTKYALGVTFSVVGAVAAVATVLIIALKPGSKSSTGSARLLLSSSRAVVGGTF